MSGEPVSPIERPLNRPETWFILSVVVTWIHSLYPNAIGSSSHLVGVFAVPFLAGIFCRWSGAASATIGYAIVAGLISRDPAVVLPGVLAMFVEAGVAVVLGSKPRPRLDSQADVYVLCGLAIAATASRVLVTIFWALFTRNDPLTVGLANASGGLFSIFVVAPALLAWRDTSDRRSWNGFTILEISVLGFLITAGVLYLHQNGESLIQNVPIGYLAILTLVIFWIAIRYELKGMATAIFLIIFEIVFFAVCTGSYRVLSDSRVSEFHHHLVLLLFSVLFASSLLIAAIARSQRQQSRETLLLVAALRQKAEKTISLNHKLTIQSERIRNQSEQLLIQYADMEDANSRLASQQAWLDAVLSSMPVGVYIVDRDGRTLERSHTFNLTKGLDDNLPSRSLHEIANDLQVCRPDGQSFPVEEWPIVRALRSGQRVLNEVMKIRQSDGTWQILSVNAAPILNTAGEITGAVASSVNVTEREQTRLGIEESERRVRFALRSAKAIVWERQFQGGMTSRTSSMAEWLDFPIESGFDNLDVYFSHTHPDDRARVIEDFRVFSSTVGEFASEYRMVKRNGDIIWILTRGETTGDADGRPRRIVGVHFDISEQKETEKKLRFLESAIIHTRDAVVLIDANVLPNAGRSVLYVNDAFCRMAGYDRSEVVGRSLNVLRGPDSDATTLDQIRTALDRGLSFQTEILNYRKNGTAYWAELTLEPVRDATRRIQHWVMIQRDITDRRRAEDALRRSEEMFRGVFENAWAGVSLTDPQGRFVSANPSFIAMLGGRTESDLIGRHARDVTSPDWWERQRLIVQEFTKGTIDRYHLKKEYLRLDGTSFWGELFCNAIRGPGGEFLYGLGVTVDVTERTKLEHQLRESEARLRAVYENSAAGVIVVDPDSVIVEVNPAFAKMLGYDATELVRVAVSNITHPDDILQERLKLNELMDGVVDNAQIRKRYLRKDGGIVIADLYTRCIRDDRGIVKFRIGVSIDMTDRLRLEEQLRHAQKMEAIGQMAGGIAHDFNNLLTAIIGNLSLVKRSQSDDILHLVTSAEQAAGRAADLTRKLLGFARRSQLQLAPLDVRFVVLEVVDILRRTLNPLIVIETQLGICSTVRADSTLLNQVLLNLCLNSRDALPEGGRITIATNDVEHESPPAGIAPGRFINLSVTDTGEGMSHETKARIFEPFFTTKAVGKGTGLGLSMVMGTIQQHGGWVDCASDLGVGTRFDLYLPISNVAIDQSSGSGDETPVEIEIPKKRLGEELILIVDDEPLVRSLARAILESDGYSVAESEDGMDAVEWVRTHPGAASLIVMDVTMPRLSGRDAYDQICVIDPNVRVIFSSGYSAEDMSEVISSVGMLAKPYRPIDLLRTVRIAIDRVGS